MYGKVSFGVRGTKRENEEMRVYIHFEGVYCCKVVREILLYLTLVSAVTLGGRTTIAEQISIVESVMNNDTTGHRHYSSITLAKHF